jgi:hypothetical protein
MILNGDRTKLGEYMRDVADKMGLRDWHLWLSKEPAPQDPYDKESKVAAHVHVVHGSKRATISFHKDWMHDDPDEFRQNMVHELIHCHTAPMRWAVNNVKFTASGPMYEVICAAYEDAHEVAVDDISRAWAEFMPLPEEWERERSDNEGGSDGEDDAAHHPAEWIGDQPRVGMEEAELPGMEER